MVVYATDNAFNGGLAIQTIRDICCGFFELKTVCKEAGWTLDSRTGHRVCSGCSRITVESGLRRCDICEKEFIDPSQYHDVNYEVNCPRCVEEYGL